MTTEPQVIADDLSVLIGSHPIVYRLSDSSGLLLYIGSSIRVAIRLAEHRVRQDWWGEVSSVALQVFPTSDDMKAAELAAIEAEAPLYNIVGNSTRLALDFGSGGTQDRHAVPRRSFQMDARGPL